MQYPNQPTVPKFPPIAAIKPDTISPFKSKEPID